MQKSHFFTHSHGNGTLARQLNIHFFWHFSGADLDAGRKISANTATLSVALAMEAGKAAIRNYLQKARANLCEEANYFAEKRDLFPTAAETLATGRASNAEKGKLVVLVVVRV
jgi:hypothetical protein